MLRPAALVRPVCPMCGEFGIHPTAQQCIEAQRAEIDRLKTQPRRTPIDPSVGYLARWVPSFYP